MNDLTSRQRKLIYAGCVLLLLIPIVYFGAPNTEDDPGGVLAQMRVQYDLGESTLGEIDPSSAAMNLVLLGLRGPAAGVLHLKALDYQEKKDWAKLKTTVDSIIKLQPHYVEIWKFQGWNLAFNVSREWDKVADRFYWVKEGIKFLQLGTNRNQSATILYHNVGDFMGRKFGNSDEKKFFRRFFVNDPDNERFPEPESDPEINPQGKDNYLVAYDWFVVTNEKDRIYRIDGMTHVFARQGPARAKFDYANARQNDGVFGEENRNAWGDAYTEWTERYGNDVFLGMNDVKYKLNCTPEDLKALAKENGVTLATQANIWEQNVKMVNYRFWQNLANCERDELTVAAHTAIYNGKVAYSQGKISDAEDENGKLQPSEAEVLFLDGMQKLEDVLRQYPEVSDHDDYIEEAMLATYYWEKVHQYNGKDLPPDFPSKILVMQNMSRQMDVERQFLLESRQGFGTP